MEQLMTAAEVAEYLQVAVRTVYKLARQGDLPCIKIGKQYRFCQAGLRNVSLKLAHKRKRG